MTDKFCYDCRNWLPLSAFNKNKRKNDGLQTECRDCCAVYRNNWRSTRHPSAWRASPDAQRRNGSARRARKRNAFVEHVTPSVVFERDGGVCQICMNPIGEETWHVDHVIPLARGGTHEYANVQLSHGSCNIRKSSKLPEEMQAAVATVEAQ